MQWESESTPSRKELLILALVVAAVILLAQIAARAQDGPPGPPPATVRTEPAAMQNVQEHRQVTGGLRAVARARVATQEEGAVTAMHVDEGAAVTKGQLLAELDSRRLRAQLEEARGMEAAMQATIDRRQAELVKAERDLRTVEAIYKDQAANEREYQDARTAVAVAKAQLDEARQALEQTRSQIELLNIRLQDTRVVAPFDGRVVEQHAEVGEWIRPGDPLVTMVSSGTIEAWLEAPEALLGGIDKDTRIEVAVQADGQNRLAASVKRVPQVDPRTRTFHLVLELDNRDDRLVPGMSVSAWLPLGKATARLTLNKDAVTRVGRSAGVWVAADDGKGGHIAVQKPVTVLFETASHVVVADGAVQVGDKVIVEGNERLFPQTPLVIVPAGRDDMAATTAPAAN